MSELNNHKKGQEWRLDNLLRKIKKKKYSHIFKKGKNEIL